MTLKESSKSMTLVFALFGALFIASHQAHAQSPEKAEPAPATAPQAEIPAPAHNKSPEPEFSSNIAVEKIAFATDISSRTPVGSSNAFAADVGAVYCWNQLAVSQLPGEILHEWYFNGDKVGQSSFRVRYKYTRVWSKRKVRPGHWRVEIKDAKNGELIAVGAFIVRKRSQ